MILTTFNDVELFLLDDRWDANQEFKLDVSLTRDLQTGLTKREARRAYSATPLCKAQYQVTVFGEALRKLQGALRALNTQPVIAPLWPAAIAWSLRAVAPISGGLLVVWKADWSQYEIYAAGDEPAWPAADDMVAPALSGFLDLSEELKLETSTVATWQIALTESSPASQALTAAAAAFDDGPIPAGYAAAPKLLPFKPDFTEISEMIKVDVKRDNAGFGREQYDTFYPQVASRTQVAQFVLRATEIGEMLRFFLDIAGPGKSFWASGWFQVGTLTADAAADATVISLEDTDALAGGDYVALFNGSLIARKLTATSPDSITLDAAPGVALNAGQSFIFPLHLVRLDKPSITLSWVANGVAKCELQWTEVPPEVLIPDDETLAETIGALPTRAALYEFSRDLGNGTILKWYFTSFENDLDWNGHTWLARRISNDDITQSLNLEEDGCTITSFKFAGNPMLDDVMRIAEAPLSVKIYFADLAAGAVDSASLIFSGDCTAPGRDGDKLTMKCKTGSGLFDNQLPFFIRGLTCNHLRGSNADGSFLISAGCTLLKSDWKFTATVAGPVSAAFPFTLHLADLARVTGAAPTFFDDWFAFGWIELGVGAAIQRRAIIGSTTPAAGILAVTLHRYFRGAPNIGDTVVLYPGCDGQFATCKAYDATTNPTGKFDNMLNFGAEPFTPQSNPSTTGQPNVGVHGGKK